MQTQNKTQSKMKKKFPIIILYFVIGVVFASIVSYSAVREAYRNRKIETDVENLRQQAKKIQNENDTLSKTIAYLDSQDNIRKTAKQKLNMQEPDESVVVVKSGIAQDQPVIATEGSEKKTLPEIPNYLKWLNFFFKYN